MQTRPRVRRAPDDGVQRGQLVCQRLAGGRAGGDDDVMSPCRRDCSSGGAALHGVVEGFRLGRMCRVRGQNLVTIRLGYPEALECFDDARVGPSRPRRDDRFPLGQHTGMHDLGGILAPMERPQQMVRFRHQTIVAPFDLPCSAGEQE